MRFNNIDIYSEYNYELTETMRKESAHIIDMYLRLLKFYDNDHCKKLNISCNEKANRLYIRSSRNGYISLQIPFSPDKFTPLPPKEKSCFYLSLIHQSILYIGAKWGWNLRYFDFLQSCIISSNFKNQWMHGKPSKSCCMDKSAQLRIVQTINNADIFLIITQKRKVTKKIPVAETEPVLWKYRPYLGTIRWIGNDSLIVYGKEGQIIFETSDV